MNKNELVYPIVIKKTENTGENDYLVTSPIKDLNIIATASSFNEALRVGQSSIEFTLFDMYEENIIFPKISEDELISIEMNKKKDDIISYVRTDLNQVLNKFGNKPIKKMISIPEYQEFWLKNNNISLSKFLQEAIESKISLEN
ncbi:hypothetical protein JNUCC83_09715 [Vagococcus sp. JNUCC 83]